jgi:Chalcone isomerase-like
MKKKSLFVIVLLIVNFMSMFAQNQYQTKGVVVPRYIDYQDRKLELNGFGTRSKLWIDVYVQALYLTILSQDPKEIMEGKSVMAIRIQIISSLVTSKKLSKAFKKGLIKSVGEENISKIQPQADLLNKFITDGETKDKDFFNLIYAPSEESILVFKNDKLVGKIPGFDFKKALFGIWLSDNPVDKDLKNQLLGKN